MVVRFLQWLADLAARNPPWLIKPWEGNVSKRYWHFIVSVNRPWPIKNRFWLCPLCLRWTKVGWRRRLSEYVDDRGNWLFSCKECHDEDTEQLKQDWEEYYRSVL